MAWQLIYTSAPRLLEAGRSGFGTVARHRDMSPLLVSAVERVSQFSRQPGLDVARVIYSHRVMSISGARYHVLSCIRDAGADYTGRTNHVAHHVIVDSREIAQAGTDAPTPAEILLGMPWLLSWEEPPRSLGPEEELDLRQFHRQTGLQNAAWEHATGSAENAWLLANGPASRGVYIVAPPAVDLRWLFAESMRVAPDRSWQNSCTTSFQPSDESSDFRWIGLEENSVLRNTVENTGRPVLDLTKSQSLPEPEIPYVVPSAPLEAVVVGLVADEIALPECLTAEKEIQPEVQIHAEEVVTTTAQDSVAIPRRVSIPKVSLATAKPPHPASPCQYGSVPVGGRRSQRLPVRALTIGAVALVFVGVLGFGFLWPLANAKYRAWKMRSEIADILRRTSYFQKAEEQLRGKEVADEVLPLTKRIAIAGAESVQLIREARLGEMGSKRLDPELQVRVIEAGIGRIPEEVKILDDKMGKFSEWYVKTTAPADGQVAQSRVDELELVKSELEKIAENTPNPDLFENCKSKLLRELRDRQVTLVGMLLKSDGEPEWASAAAQSKIGWFEEKLNSLETTADDKQKIEIQELRGLIVIWKAIESRVAGSKAEGSKELPKDLLRGRDTWPRWLNAKAGGHSPGGKQEAPTVAKSLPGRLVPADPAVFRTYYVRELSRLEKLSVPSVDSSAEFFVQMGVDAPRRPLRKIENKLWMDINAQRAMFELDAQGEVTQLRAIPGSEGTILPMAVVAQNPAGMTLYQIWVFSVSQGTPFAKQSGGIVREGDQLRILPASPVFRGAPQTALWLQLPKECAMPGGKPPQLTIADWRIDPRDLRTAIEDRRRKLNELETARNASGGMPGKDQAPPEKINALKNLAVEFWQSNELVRNALVGEIDRWAKESVALATRGKSLPDKESLERTFEANRRKKIEALGTMDQSSEALHKRLARVIMAVARDKDIHPEPAWEGLYSSGSRLINAEGGAMMVEVEEIRKNINKFRNQKDARNRYGGLLDQLAQMVEIVATADAPAVINRPIIAASTKANEGELAELTANPLLNGDVPRGVYYLIAKEGGEEIQLLEIEVP